MSPNEGFSIQCSQVDREGNLVHTNDKEQAELTPCSLGALSEHKLIPTLNPMERSFKLWQKLIPSYLPQLYTTPLSTAHSHYRWDAALVETKTGRHHFKKTDFSEYTEVSLRLMRHLK